MKKYRELLLSVCFILLGLAVSLGSCMAYRYFSGFHMRGQTIICFGDSILDYTRGSHGVCGLVAEQTGAEVYNFAVEGTTAGYTGNPCHLLNMVDAFLSEDYSQVTREDLRDGVKEMQNFDRGQSIEYIIVEYGLNDYFEKIPLGDIDNLEEDTESYLGGLNAAIDALQDRYPETAIILFTPTYTLAYTQGTEDRGHGALQDYVEGVKELAEKKGVYCQDNYQILQIDRSNADTYLRDGTHLNDNGSNHLAYHTIEFLRSIQE